MAARKTSKKNLTEEARLAKNKQIKEKGIETRTRRASMDVKVRDLKIQTSSLNQKQKEALQRIFLESKWIYNSALANNRTDLEYLDELNGAVQVKLPDGRFDEREIRHLGSQMQQSVIRGIKNSIKALSESKRRGRKVGKLKFVSEYKSIDLQQYGVTYKLIDANKDKVGFSPRFTKIQVQNVPGKLRVRGYDQLVVEGIEFANAKLVVRADGYHLLVTTYVPRENKPVPLGRMGVDGGVKASFTTDDGSVVNARVEETERLKYWQRKLSRQVKGSNGYRKTQGKIRREYEKLSYKKDDLARKLVHDWTIENRVFFQDELLSLWKRKNGLSRGSRVVQYGILGRVKSLLSRNSDNVMLPKWVATTSFCDKCGGFTKHGLEERVFECSHCHFSEDRDQHSARLMIVLGLRFEDFFTSGTEGSAGGEEVRLKQALYNVPA